MYYILTKLSSKGFRLESSDIEVILDILERYICSSCTSHRTREQIEEDFTNLGYLEWDEEEVQAELDMQLPSNMEDFPPKDKIIALLGTVCGAEFMFEEFDSFEHMVLNEERE